MRDKIHLNKIKWEYIVVDEGHRMKNHNSKFAMALGQNYHSAQRLLLTGTPLQNDLTELWALLNFILPKIFNSCEEFKMWFDKPLQKLGVQNNSEKESLELSEVEKQLLIQRLHQILRPFLLRRVKKEVEKELPDKKIIVIKIELSAWQEAAYESIQELKTVGTADNKQGQDLQNRVMQLRKICNHPYLFLNHYEAWHMGDNLYRTSGKFELLDRILPKLLKFDHKILIFSQMTQLMDIMEIYFAYRKLKHLRLDGSTKADDRKDIMQRFNEPDTIYKIFLLSTRAGG